VEHYICRVTQNNKLLKKYGLKSCEVLAHIYDRRYSEDPTSLTIESYGISCKAINRNMLFKSYYKGVIGIQSSDGILHDASISRVISNKKVTQSNKDGRFQNIAINDDDELIVTVDDLSNLSMKLNKGVVLVEA